MLRDPIGTSQTRTMSKSSEKNNEVFANTAKKYKKTDGECSLTSYCHCCGFLCFSKSINGLTPPYSPGPPNSGNLFFNDSSKEYPSSDESKFENVSSFLYPFVSNDLKNLEPPETPPKSGCTLIQASGDLPHKNFSYLASPHDLHSLDSVENLPPNTKDDNSRGCRASTSQAAVTPLQGSKESQTNEEENKSVGQKCIFMVVTSPKDSAITSSSLDHSEDAHILYPSLSDMALQQPSNHVFCNTSSEAASQEISNSPCIASSCSGGRTRSLLESRRGSHTSLTLTLTPASLSHNHLQVPGYAERTSSGGCLLPGSQVSAFSFSRLHCRGLSPSPAVARSHLYGRHLLPMRHASVADAVETDGEAEIPSAVSSPCPSSSPPPPGQALTSNLTADREKLTSGSIPLSGKSLQKKLRQDFASLFSEFWSIPTNHMNKCDFPLPGVCQKNRYPSILPNNETRVVLPPINNDVTSTYINANFISGYRGEPGAFIATQGPMSHTVNDFWRMVWFVRAPAIVMLTKLVERSRVKCELYLPHSKDEHRTSVSKLCTPNRADTVPDSSSVEDRMTNSRFLQSARSLPFPSPRALDDNHGESTDEVEISRVCSPAGSEQLFGSIHVRVVSVVSKRGYTKRQLVLRQGNEERTLTHFWCVSWPDHSSPDVTPAAAHHLLNLVFEVESCRSSRSDKYLSYSTPSTPVTTSEASAPAIRRRTNTFHRQHATEDVNTLAQLNSPQSSPIPSSTNSPSSLRIPAFDDTVSSRGYRASDPVQLPTSTSGPVVVHCSAGIGRTGCFIALCIGCQQLREENMVDVFGIVSRLRLDRGGMIEDHSQYAFLHIALSTYYSLQRGITPPDFLNSDLAMGFPRPG